MKMLAVALAFCSVALCQPAQPIIDNERVTIWDVTWSNAEANPIPRHDLDFVTIY